MKSFIKTTIKRPVTVCILVIVLMAVGVLATLDMSTNLLPNIKMPMLGISVVYPGASATSVEQDVTQKIDSALKTVAGVTDLETMSYDNASIAVVTFNYGTDIDEKISVIQDAFKSVTLPDSCTEPTFTKIDMNGTATATISVYQQGNSEQLYREANDLATRLRAIEGVGSVSVLGKPERQIQFNALNGLELTALLAVQALSNENLNIPLGTIMQDGTTVSIRNATDATSLLQVMQLPVELALDTSTLNSFATLKLAVQTFATCSLDDFNEYVDKACDAKELIDGIESKSADELEEQGQGLSAVKSLMTLVRNNSSDGLRLMWSIAIEPIITNESFQNMDDEALRELADQYDVSYDLLKWLHDGGSDDSEDSIRTDWDKLVRFREIYTNGYDITYDQFANLFQDGGSEQVDGREETYQGLDILHSDLHLSCGGSCDERTYTHEQAANVCQFADSVNTIAYNNIVNTVRNGEEITDAQFAALFANTTNGNGFAALISPQVIHVIRHENFNNGNGSVVDVLRKSKEQHVNSYGNAVYKLKDGKEVELWQNFNGDYMVEVCGEYYYVNSFGRLVDEDGNLIDDITGKVLSLTDDEIAANYNSYGQYVVYTDEELVNLYNDLNAALNGDVELGITPTVDTVRFARICTFDSSASNMIVPLAYIGRIEEVIKADAFSQYNGMLSVTLEVYAVSDANTTDVVNGVKAIIANSNYSSAVILLDDKAEFINDSIVNVLSSIIVGGVLAVLVIYLFVRKIGSSLVVSITMPLSVLVALIGLWLMKISLNLVSLGGLAVGIGMLVDNSIVVLESITKRRDRGESVFDSCLNGTKEVAGSLLASTLTNVCVFFPILFAKGLTKEIFNDLVWAVLFSIVMSLIVAITVIPSLYHLIYSKPRLRRNKKDGVAVAINSYEELEPRAKAAALDETPQEDKQQKHNNAARKEKREKLKQKLSKVSISRLESGYGKILEKVLTKRVLVCVVALALFAGSVGLVFTTGMDFMPSVDKGVIEVDIDFNATTTLDDATKESQRVVGLIQDKYGDKLSYVALTVGEQGLLATHNSGIVRIQTVSGKLNTSKTVQEIRQMLKDAGINAQSVAVREIDGVVAEVTGGMAGQSVELVSDDMETLRAAANAVAEKLRTVDTAHIQNVVDNTAQKTLQYSFVFDRVKCIERGVDYQMAVMLLRVGLSGYTAAIISIDGERQDVNVQFANVNADIDSVLNSVVGVDSNGIIKLSDVLTYYDGKPYVEEYVDSSIIRHGGKYSTSIDMEIYGIDSGSVGKIINRTVKEVLAAEQFNGVEYSEAGVASYLNDAFNGLVVSLVAAFVLLYSVMACQFESLTKPFIVIMSIPFSFTGGFLALVITGTTLNVVSFVGLIMLMGVIVNGAIVMIDKIGQLTAEGLTPQEAVIEGCKSRLRPILMTTLTTILALVPLALGLGRGGELMRPMGIVVLGGLLLGTLVTLVLIPCFYCIIKKISFKKPKQPTDDVESNANAGDGNTETTQQA